MNTWADYVITAVHFNSKHTHIDTIKCHLDNGDKLGPFLIKSRLEVIAEMKGGVTYATAYLDGGTWHQGKKVYIITVNRNEYIKTVDNGKEEDNLDNLPEY